MKDLAIITRFHYPQDHPDFEWRFEYYRTQVLPRLLKQTDSNFDIWIWCEPHHDKDFLDLNPRINVFHGTFRPREGRFFNDSTNFSNIEGLPKYRIQFGLDSDELVSKNIVRKAKMHCTGNQSVLVSFQPVLRDLKTGNLYYMKRKYNKKFASAVLAYYQPDLGDEFKFLYHTTNHRMVKYANKVVVVPEGYAEVSIHDFNSSTRIHSGAKRYRGILK